MGLNKGYRKNRQEIKEKMFELFKKKRSYSINELSRLLDSNWSTIQSIANETSFLEPEYKQVKCGLKLKELDETEKKMLKIILSDADKEGLSSESVKKYEVLRKNWNKKTKQKEEEK